jgi:hypothetical protein
MHTYSDIPGQIGKVFDANKVTQKRGIMETISNEETKVSEKLTNRLTITELAERIGITPKTIIRWEKAGKIKKPKRDWKGWRFYEMEDIESIQRIISTVYEI